jgi:hypothetical protein
LKRRSSARDIFYIGRAAPFLELFQRMAMPTDSPGVCGHLLKVAIHAANGEPLIVWDFLFHPLGMQKLPSLCLAC